MTSAKHLSYKGAMDMARIMTHALAELFGHYDISIVDSQSDLAQALGLTPEEAGIALIVSAAHGADNAFDERDMALSSLYQLMHMAYVKSMPCTIHKTHTQAQTMYILASLAADIILDTKSNQDKDPGVVIQEYVRQLSVTDACMKDIYKSFDGAPDWSALLARVLMIGLAKAGNAYVQYIAERDLHESVKPADLN